MFRLQGVLVLIALYVRFAHSLTWDIVVARSNRLEFYDEGTLVYTATPTAHHIKWISYDPKHDRILFADQHNTENSVSSFDIGTNKTQPIIKKNANQYLTRFAYDPATELIFGTDKYKLYSFSIQPKCNYDVSGDLVLDFESVVLHEVATDSYGGYIYWIANNIIERSLFNGSEREIIIDKFITVKQGLTIDTENIYWIESDEYNDGAISIETADLTGNNRRTIYRETESNSSEYKLTVSKDFIFWGNSIENFFWKLPKNSTNETDIKPDKISMISTISSCGSEDIAAYYEIQEQTQAISVCHNYCLQGDCNVTAEGQPECRCNTGYTGDRCTVSLCHNYCVQGDCNINDEGPNCRCIAGYSGKRCEVYACNGYCLHNGVCSLNNNSEPVCKCTGQYEGKRCTVDRKPYEWLPMMDGELPPNAIVGGFDSENTYVARAYHKGSLCPGKYAQNYKKVYIPWGGKEHVKENYEILCGVNPKWVKVNSNIIPHNAFIGGRTGGADPFVDEHLYVCKAEVNGKMISGKAYGRDHKCYLSYGGEETETFSYEILVVADDEI